MLSIRSKEDIDVLYNRCMNSEDISIELNVEYIYDPIEFVLSGFIPAFITYKPALLDLVRGVDPQTLSFIYRRLPDANLRDLKDKKWVFHKMEYYVKLGKEECESFGLILYYPEMLYKSMRPKTDMSMFRGPNARTVSRKDLRDGVVTIDGEDWNYSHVTRYAAGMSKGLYFDDLPPNVCGTFYYEEPESTTILVYKTSMKSFNKTTAASDLSVDAARGMIMPAKKQKLLDHAAGKYPADLVMTPNELVSKARIGDSLLAKKLPQVPRYIGGMLDIYGSEDPYDQPLCKEAKRRGFDVVILTNMVGSHQVVTELLDTRDRADSMNSLVFLV